MWLLLVSLQARADALVGVDWVPFDRGDLAWVDDGQLSGTLVGEGDGFLVPAMSAWGGWADAHNAALIGLGGARLATVTTSGSSVTGSAVAALRPSVDYRRYLLARQPGHAAPWVQVGAYGDIPAATTWAETSSEAEQEALDAADAETKARIGGWGLRLGGGASVAWEDGLSLGARYLGVFHRSSMLSDDGSRTTSTWLRGEAALELAFAFPVRAR